MLNKEKTVEPTSESGNDAKPIVRRSLPLSNADLWAMAQLIVEKQKNVLIVDSSKIDWNMLEGEWFDWLEEKLMGNDA